MKLWKITMSTAVTPGHEALVSGGEDALVVLQEWLIKIQAKRQAAGLEGLAFSPPVSLTIEEAE